MTISTKGGKTAESRTFLITRTVSGGLYHVNLCDAGSWIALKASVEKWLYNLSYSFLMHNYQLGRRGRSYARMSFSCLETLYEKNSIKLIAKFKRGVRINGTLYKRANGFHVLPDRSTWRVVYRFYRLHLIIHEPHVIASADLENNRRNGAKVSDEMQRGVDRWRIINVLPLFMITVLPEARTSLTSCASKRKEKKISHFNSLNIRICADRSGQPNVTITRGEAKRREFTAVSCGFFHISRSKTF